jgi:hypothetical protein
MPNEPDNTEISLRFRVALLINDLTHRDKVIRDDAEEQIVRIGKEAIPPVIDAFEKEYKAYLSRDCRLRRAGNWLNWSALIIPLTVSTILLVQGNIIFVSVFVILFMTFGSLSIIFNEFGRRTPKRLSAIYELLLKMDKLQIVDVILEMYSADTIWLSKEAMDLLQRHLPHITLKQRKNLTPKQRKAFYRLLEQRAEIISAPSFDFALAGLSALEHVGDAEAIPTVEHIAKHGSNQRLRSAAKECLPSLHIRRAEDAIRQTLLRASQSSGGNAELLRIPTHAPDNASEQLLRMAQEEK